MNRNKILFVDDEVNILNSIKRCVIEQNYEAIFATNANKAIDILKSQEIAVLVTDMRMPLGNGLDLLKTCKNISPLTVRVVLSGYISVPQILAAINTGEVFRFITKPWEDDEEFIPAINSALDYYNLKKEREILKEELKEKNRIYENLMKESKYIIDNIHDDILSIKNLNDNILDFLMGFCNQAKEKTKVATLIENYILRIKNIYLGYLDTMPSQNMTFKICKLKKDILKYKNLYKEIIVDNDDFNHEGNYKLILYIISTIIKEIMKNSFNTNLKIIISSYPSLKILMEFDKNIKNQNISLTLIVNMLNAFIKRCGGKVYFDENKNIVLEGNTKI
ncbi:response regulator [Clostridium botulinum]|uniref:response regulator n=2 Tax=Clostridium botulinum TaxID=1491 RepID=UPI00068C9142|nr:response regulator [Clostridium botulinum]MCD3233325.1 response regulator [Clostridium botulinum D/C]MCD3239074.1 response regulator [Clostridium botulinum D/C]MCD3266744.1 response regulator [Clostridium botulinum D/C]MCD3298536.1 response regulator [Clostridium botulinum D/C]MCD3304983.1 response regulator [Clostridium botulinum D/C]